MIYSYENFLTPSECQYFINQHSKLFNPANDRRSAYHRKTEVIDYSLCFVQDSKKLNGRLNFTVKNIDPEAFINYFQIVKWPTDEFQPLHKDFTYHCYTSIIYLNDNFEGGETVVEKKKIKPKQGLMVLFAGDKMTHGVNKIKKGTRYTIPCWYTK
jgi:hypothetical protein|tara:strand:- start:31 stop:498 length:468 start_codon:yes stop_codon:yes gene_type:complete